MYQPPPANVSPPTISGDALQGQVLTEAHGAWSGAPTSYGYQWERCDGAGGACQGIAGATSQTYLLAPADVGSTIRVQESASNGTGEGSPAVSTQTGVVQAVTAPGAPHAVAPPPPILARRGIAKVIAGQVLVRLEGTTKFVPLSGATGIPNGSEVDATRGRVLITVATLTPGKTESAEVYGGVFEFRQGRAHALAHLALSAPLTGCPRLPSGHRPGRTSATGAAHRSRPKSRHLWVSEGGGSWGTSGRYVSTTVEGTRWLTLDECERSLVRVAAGRVRVHDLINNTTRTLTAGESYVAVRSPRRQRHRR